MIRIQKLFDDAPAINRPSTRSQKRPPMSARRKRYLFLLHGGICHICKYEISGSSEGWEISHVIEWAISRDDSDENCHPAHKRCHAVHTAENSAAVIAKTHRQQDMFYGFKESRNPVPGSRDTRFKKKMNGRVEFR